MKVLITKNDTTCSYNMKRLDKGVFYAKIEGDYDNCRYVYLVRHHDEYCFTVDPYAYKMCIRDSPNPTINFIYFSFI